MFLLCSAQLRFRRGWGSGTGGARGRKAGGRQCLNFFLILLVSWSFRRGIWGPTVTRLLWRGPSPGLCGQRCLVCEQQLPKHYGSQDVSSVSLDKIFFSQKRMQVADVGEGNGFQRPVAWRLGSQKCPTLKKQVPDDLHLTYSFPKGSGQATGGTWHFRWYMAEHFLPLIVMNLF